MSRILQKLGLKFNPFEPTGADVPVVGLGALSFPQAQEKQTKSLLTELSRGRGAKGIVFVGEYGAGKTCLLQRLHREIFPEHRVKSFYFDNPGVHFYDLANTLLRTVGRKDFAKFVWELAGPYAKGIQRSLFTQGLDEILSTPRSLRDLKEITRSVRNAVIEAEIESDEQIADCIARIVTNTINKPYFEYRDFIPRLQGSVVAEREEPRYFRAILKTIAKGNNANAVAFLIDEFEEIGLQKRLTRRAAQDYLVTLKRLIDLSETHDEPTFWLVLSMTRDAYDITRQLDEALSDRLEGGKIEIPPFGPQDATALVRSRLNAARTEGKREDLFPFPNELPFNNKTLSNARRLVKACFFSISKANDSDVDGLPFSKEYLRLVEKEIFPPSPSNHGENSHEPTR